MSLLEQINGDLLKKLSGTSSSSGGSTIAGKGVASSFGNEAVDLSASLEKLALAFKDSDSRLTTPLSVIKGTRDLLITFKNLNEEMISLAKRAASEDTSSEERGDINTKFQGLVQAYNHILDNSTVEDIDIRDKFDLKGLLTTAGINLSASSKLSTAFSELAASDEEIGYSLIASEDVAVVSQSGDIEVGRADGSLDPLTQNLQTRSTATIAYNTLIKLEDDINEDLEKTNIIVEELNAADNFAIAGNTASVDLLSSPLSGFSVEQLASELVNRIKSFANDSRLSAHSDLDRLLAEELLED